MLKAFVRDIASVIGRPRGLLTIFIAIVFGAAAIAVSPPPLYSVITLSWIGILVIVLVVLGGLHAALRGVVDIGRRPDLAGRIDSLGVTLEAYRAELEATRANFALIGVNIEGLRGALSDLPTMRSNIATLRDSTLELAEHLSKHERQAVDVARLEKQMNLLQDIVASLEGGLGRFEAGSLATQEKIRSQLKLLEDSVLAIRAREFRDNN